jgi:ATPase subunit of ABC transporter with duplicated ATPase domains
MKLVKVQATNFRSIEDSGEFEVGDLTCLVGKNEAGKTAVLRAIQGIRPTDSFEYDRTRDYPRRYLNKFDERHPDGESPVARTWWSLDDDDIAEIEATLGDDVLQSSQIEVTSYIGRSGNTWSVHIDQKKCLRNLEASPNIS